ncbi:MAG: N-acetylmuramoyl-L-alanine amidase [Actinomycetota bacterium]
MRRRHLLSLALALTIVPSGLVLPVVTFPTASPHPVAAKIHRTVVHGVDAMASTGAPRARAQDGGATRIALLTSPRSTSSFSTIGVTWRSGTAAAGTVVQARTRTGGQWSAWSDLDVVDAPGAGDRPNASASGGPVHRDGTEPSYVGPSDGYQVQVSSPSGTSPVDVQVVAVDPGTSPADATAASGEGVPASSASAEASQPTINSRASWGANEALRNCGPDYMSTVKAVVVHHTVSANGYSSSAVPSMIRGIYAYHTNGLGWCDIGYNVLVDRFGGLWEGRFGGLSRPVMSAATGGFNTYTSAISALGNFDTASAPAAMVDAIARWASWKLGVHHVSPVGRTSLVSSGGSFTPYPAGRVVGLPTIFGHRDSDLTACPGRYLYAQLPTIRSKAFAYAGPSLFSPGLYYTRISTRDFPNFVVNAGTQRAQTWALSVSAKGTTTPIYTATGSSVGNQLSAIWPRTTTAGKPVGAGIYDLVLTSSTARAWTGQVTITGDAVIPPGDPSPALATVYTTPGTTISTGREWRTTCEAYSTTARRCFTSIFASWIERTSSGYRTVVGWKLNNLSYMDQGNAAWGGNPLAAPGEWQSGGHRWRTTCSPAVTVGPRQCRTEIWSSLLTHSGTKVVRFEAWVVNNIVWLGDGK